MALGLIAAAVIASEILLTRIFSFITWHHYTPLVIGIALLGFGCAGSYLSVRGRAADSAMDPSAFDARLGREALAFALTLPVSLALVSRVPFNPSRIFAGPGASAWLLVEIALVVVPFIAAGLFICRILARYRVTAGRVYAIDLGASALGVLLGLGLLRVTSAEVAILAVALLVAAAAYVVSPDPGVRRATTAIGLALGLATFVAAFLPARIFHPPPSKEMAVFEQDPVRRSVLTWSRWHPIARIDVTAELTGPAPDFGGELAAKARPHANSERYRYLFQDGTAPSAFLHLTPPIEGPGFLTSYLQSAPYVIRPEARVLVIGVGGGIDLAIGIAGGARSITGVEINPVTLGLLEDDLADYVGGLPRDPRIRLVGGEGRAFVRGDRSPPYDVIQLSGADTFAALVSGSGSLTEGYLYTREALADFLGRLAPGGVLSFSRPYFTPPRETLKLIATACETLRERGVADPSRHVLVIAGRSWAETLIARDPLTPTEVQALEDFAQRTGFQVLATPSAELDSPWDRYLSLDAESARRFRANYFFNVEPATDDRPFFYDYARWGHLLSNRHLPVNLGYEGYYTAESPFGPLPVGNLMLALAVLVIGFLALVLIVCPLFDRTAALAEDPGLAARVLGGAAALGLGFIAIEITLIQSFQLFLGGPALALGTVLAALLGAAGLGSRTAERLSPNVLRQVMPAIAVLAAGSAFLLPVLTRVQAGAPLLVRVAVAGLLTAVPGFLLGMPFPLLIRLIAARRPGLVPWMWAANGALSVLGSVLATFAAMGIGFRNVTLAAAAIYLLGFLVLFPETGRLGAPSTRAARAGAPPNTRSKPAPAR
jgi:predicted membrane-bound spermidine synthase